MHSLSTLAAGAATIAVVVAQTLPNPVPVCINGEMNNPAECVNATVLPIAQALDNIVISVGVLDTAILAYDGTNSSAQGVVTDSQALLGVLTQGDANIAALTPLTDDNVNDVLYVLDYLNAAEEGVNKTVQDLINIKDLIVSTCQGPTALAQLQMQLPAAEMLINDTFAIIINPDIIGVAEDYTGPILDALSSGVAAYAAETTTAAGCSPSPESNSPTSVPTTVPTTGPTSGPTSGPTTEPTTEPTTGPTTTTTGPGAGTFPTSGYPTGGSSPTSPTYPASSVYSSGGSYPVSSGGSSPGGSSYSASSYSASSSGPEATYSGGSSSGGSSSGGSSSSGSSSGGSSSGGEATYTGGASSFAISSGAAIVCVAALAAFL